jgi:hypothetical protein
MYAALRGITARINRNILVRPHAASVLVIALIATACERPTEVNQITPTPVKTPGLSQEGYTPLQNRIANSFANRKARGLATPSVSFEFASPQGSSVSAVRGRKYGSEEGYSFTAITVIRYRGPAEAGLKEWPALTLSPEQSQKLRVTQEEFRERYVVAKDKQAPGFWNRHKLGQEPRTYTIKERETVTYPKARAAPAMSLSATTDVSALATNQQDLVFGFSIDMPRIDDGVSFGIDDVEELEFSWRVDWDFGIRLPVAGTINSVEPMLEGSTYSPTSSMAGLNYSAADYAAVGLPTQGGNEVFFRWLTQVCIEFSGAIDSGKQCAGPDIRRSNDFTTPFGSGASVPFPTIDLALYDYGIAGIDLEIKNRVGSELITGDWSTVGAAIGSGHVEYTGPSAPGVLSSVRAIDGPGQALMSVDGLLYHFTHFSVSPSLKLWVDVEIPVPIFPDIDWEDSWPIDLGTYDLSDFIDHDFIDSNGASVGLHHNQEYTGATKLTMSVPVANVAPTAAVTVTGGSQYNFNGTPTRIGSTGEQFQFTGRSHDPGRDGLTLSWDWGDGAPSPDISTLFPLAAATGPNDAADARTHAFNRACLYDVTFKSVDDDNAFGEDHTSILITQPGGTARLDGYWQHQLAGDGSVLDRSVINCYLAIVARVSSIFGELRSVATPEDAYGVLNLAQNAGSEREQLDREILVSWLNFASGAIGYTQMLDSNGDGIADAPFSQVLQNAEAIRRNPAATAKALKEQTQIIHQISVRG